jgi:hypothetical protein
MEVSVHRPPSPSRCNTPLKTTVINLRSSLFHAVSQSTAFITTAQQ